MDVHNPRRDRLFDPLQLHDAAMNALGMSGGGRARSSADSVTLTVTL